MFSDMTREKYRKLWFLARICWDLLGEEKLAQHLFLKIDELHRGDGDTVLMISYGETEVYNQTQYDFSKLGLLFMSQ